MTGEIRHFRRRGTQFWVLLGDQAQADFADEHGLQKPARRNEIATSATPELSKYAGIVSRVVAAKKLFVDLVCLIGHGFVAPHASQILGHLKIVSCLVQMP